jgi:hypothetical protein
VVQKIELITTKDVSEFTDVVNGIDEEVTLIGKDENGKDWTISGKSFLANLLLVNSVNRAKNNPAHKVDWNTITCICEKDIYSNIKKWAVGSVME